MDIFPQDIAQMVCADFTCKERECTRDPCSFMHPCNPREMDKATVKAITQKFAITKKGWFSDYHFRSKNDAASGCKGNDWRIAGTKPTVRK